MSLARLTSSLNTYNNLTIILEFYCFKSNVFLVCRYSHDGSEYFKDGFKVGVNDGIHFVSGDVLVLIEPVDDEKPIWKNELQPRISVIEGGKVQITSQVIKNIYLYTYCAIVFSVKGF